MDSAAIAENVAEEVGRNEFIIPILRKDLSQDSDHSGILQAEEKQVGIAEYLVDDRCAVPAFPANPQVVPVRFREFDLCHVVGHKAPGRGQEAAALLSLLRYRTRPCFSRTTCFEWPAPVRCSLSWYTLPRWRRTLS